MCLRKIVTIIVFIILLPALAKSSEMPKSGSGLYTDPSINDDECFVNLTITLQQDSNTPPEVISDDDSNENQTIRENSALEQQYWMQYGYVAMITCGFGLIHRLTGQADFASLTNAITTGPTGTYYSFAMNESVTEIFLAPPTYSDGASILPLVLYGYGIYEFIKSFLNKEWLFVAHGLTLCASCGSMHYSGKLRSINHGLVLELSQIFYNLGALQKQLYLKGGESPSLFFHVPFVVLFFATRWGYHPYITLKFITSSYLDEDNFSKDPFSNRALFYCAGMINIVNAIIGVMIIRSIARKFRTKIKYD